VHQVGFSLHYIILCLLNSITEKIQVTESPNYFPRGPHVGQPYSTGFWPCHIILRFTHCLNFARHPLSRMKIKTKCFADTGTGLPHHKSMQSKGPKKNRWAPRAHNYLLLGCTARPFNSLSLLNYRCLFFPIECRLLPSLNIRLPYILFYIFQPSHSRSCHSSTSLRFTLKYFLKCPSPIHSYYMSNPLQSLLFNVCYYD